MRPLGDSPLVRNDKTLVLAHDHGLEHGPKQFSGVEERLDPREVFEMATHDAVTALAVGKGLAETYYPSYERGGGGGRREPAGEAQRRFGPLDGRPVLAPELVGRLRGRTRC